MLGLRTEHLDRSQHPEEEDESDDDESEQPASRVVGTEAREQERGGKCEENEDERGHPEPDLVSR